MKIDGWKYYNFAAIPTCAPHEEPDISAVLNGEIWKINKPAPLLARWTSFFGCEQDTGWYYVVKQGVFDINEVNAKRRYEINKGNKFFSVKAIAFEDYMNEIYEIHCAAVKTYKNVTCPSKSYFVASLKKNIKNNCILLGAFFRENQKLCGYSLLKENETYISFLMQKTDPQYEKCAINAALVYGVCEHYKDVLKTGKYICDGEKSVLHITAFQDYLEKYFQFKKVYCKLNIKFIPAINIIVKMLFPFRSIIYKIRKLDKVGAILKMQEVIKKQKRMVF